ncbi:MAG TPA: type 4a pilus biogenesis protein PilO [Acidimicrobiia bacterium]|nr:type 4a pilus biogenesis protein PilO [Acidimicrobiia bacterium]
MKPRDKTKKPGDRSTNRAVIALVVMSALVLAYGWNKVFLAPKARAKAAVAKELATARTAEQALRQNLAALQTLARDTQSREAELARLGKLVPATPDLAGAIDAFDQTARSAGVSLSSLVPAPATATATGPATLGVSMKVSGSFNQVYDYLHRLETLDRLVVVDSVSLTGSGTGGSTKVDADIRSRLFSASAGTTPQPATLTKAGS